MKKLIATLCVLTIAATTVSAAGISSGLNSLNKATTKVNTAANKTTKKINTATTKVNNSAKKATTTVNNANSAAVNTLRNNAKNINTRAASMNTKFNTSVNGISNIILTKQEIAKVKGNATQAQASQKLAQYLISSAQSANISNRVKNLSAANKAQLRNYAKDMQSSVSGYTTLAKDATALTTSIATTKGASTALVSEVKNLKQVGSTAASQATLAKNLAILMLK